MRRVATIALVHETLSQTLDETVEPTSLFSPVTSDGRGCRHRRIQGHHPHAGYFWVGARGRNCFSAGIN